MKNSIQKFDDFLSKDDFSIIQGFANHIIKNRRDYPLDSNHRRWDENIVFDSNTVLIYEIENENILNIFKKAFENKDIKNWDGHAMFYYWARGSYIPWHSDSEFNSAGTLYLNENWNRDWGGLYLFEKSDNFINGYVPKRNMFLLQNDHISHATTPINVLATEPRVTVQFFFE